MRYRGEHNPPHFHVWHQGKEAVFSINEGDLIEGKLPKKAEKLVTAWAILRKKELKENWKLVREQKPLKKIAPLE